MSGLPSAFAELVTAAERTPAGALQPVVCPDESLWELLADHLGAEGWKVERHRPVGEQWSGLVERLQAQPRRARVLHIVYGQGPATPGLRQGLAYLNLRRDAILAALPNLLLWCGPPSFLALSQAGMPDFWSMRDTTVRLEVEVGPMPQPARTWLTFRRGDVDRLRDAWYDAVRRADALATGLGLQFAEACAAVGDTSTARRVVKELRAQDPGSAEATVLAAELALVERVPSLAELALSRLPVDLRDPALTLRVAFARATVRAQRGEFAAPAFAALTLEGAAGETAAAARCRAAHGDALAVAGELDAAEDAYLTALEAFRRLGDTEAEAALAHALGDLMRHRRRAATAHEHYQLALALRVPADPAHGSVADSALPGVLAERYPAPLTVRRLCLEAGVLLQDLPEEPLAAWTLVVAHAKEAARVGTLRRVAGLDIAPRTPEVVRPDRLIPYGALGARLVGRDAARRALDKALVAGRSTRAGTVVAVVGLGGLGKTQLVVEHASEHDYPGGVYWFDADGDVDGQLGRLSERAGWTVSDAESSWKITRAREHLRSVENALVVFDNVDDFARIADLVVGAPSRRTVLVSRSLQPGFPAVTLEPLDNGSATALLTDVAGRTPAHADALLAPLAGLPLAIELAGAWLRGHPAGDGATVATDLAAAGLGAAALAGGEGFTSATAHSSDLRATLRIPDHVLASPGLRSVVDALAWSGPTRIGEELLAYMLDISVEGLRTDLGVLTDARVVEVSGGRVGMHRLVAAARREAEPLRNEEAAPIMERVVGWFRARKEDWRHLDQFEAEMDHLVAWRANAASVGLAEAEVCLWWLAAYPMYHRGRNREVTATLEEAWRLYEAHRLEVPWLEAELCLDRNWALWDLSGERAMVRRAVELCAAHPDVPNDVRVRAQLALCEVLQSLNRDDVAAAPFEAAWRLLATAVDPATLLSAPLALSVAFHFLPRIRAEAEGGALLARLMRVVGERHPKVIGARGVLASEQDKASPSRKHLRELRRLYELQCEVQGPNHPNTVAFLLWLGSSELRHRDPAAALKSFSEALRIQVQAFGQESRDPRSVRVRIGLAVALHRLHRAEDARKILAPAVAASLPGSRLYDMVEATRLSISQLPSAPRHR